MTLLVTGATGQLGSLVVKHLLAKVPAEQLAVSVRDPQKVHLKEAGVDVRKETSHSRIHFKQRFKGLIAF